MDITEQRQAAGHLLAAYKSRTATEPIIERFPHADVSDAYIIQREQVRGWLGDGDVVLGHKVGLASVAMQRQTNVDQPDYGHLLRSMFYLEHQPIPAGNFIQPRIEPEMAFVLSRTLQGPGVTVADAVRAIDCVLPALEIIDSRIRNWQLTIVDTIADNASSGGVVLGGKPVLLHAVDLRLAGCSLHRNGEVVATGAGGAVLGSPINSLVWLANTVGPLGIALEPGHVVLPGSMTRAQTMHPGDTMAASIGGIGSVTAILDRTAADG
jgi:2-keto-4-pentenoate hydratase